MSTQREKTYQLITDGYMRDTCKEYNLDIPSEIVSIVFIFYFIKAFDIEYGELIKVENNKITNICDKPFGAFMNTTVIGDWMHSDADADTDHVHTIKLKIINLSLAFSIGILLEGYNLEYPMTWLKGQTLCVSESLITYKMNVIAKLDKYNTGDIISFTLNLKLLSLSYSICNEADIVPKQEGILLTAGTISKAKYKWAVLLDHQGDCVEIIDVYSESV